MSADELRRVLAWDACRNVRDLGGLPTVGGGSTRKGALIRADSLCRLTPRGCQALLNHGIRAIVDLRFPEEIAKAPHPFGHADADAIVSYRNVPVTAGRDPTQDAAVFATFAVVQTLEESYRLELAANQRGFALIASAIARAPAGGVVVHCEAGKDRTGLVVALLLALVGVPDEVIAADYAESAANVQAHVARWVEEHAHGDAAERERLTRLQQVEPATMLATLSHLEERYGGAEAYLRSGGLTDEDVAALRRRLVGEI